MSLKSLTKTALIVFVLRSFSVAAEANPKKPPIHRKSKHGLAGKIKPQEQSRFFEDGGTMRMPVEGTIPMGDQYLRNGADYLKADSEFYTGLDANGQPIDKMPSIERLGFKEYGCTTCQR